MPILEVTRAGLVRLVRLVVAASGAAVSACANPGMPAPAPTVVALPPPDAGAAATSPAASSPAPSAAAPSTSPPGADTSACTGECRGSLSTPDLGVALQAKAGEARRCYDAALAADPTVQGRVILAVRVGSDGRVCSAEMLQSDAPDDMNACITALFERARFPPPTGGCIVAHVPMLFKPVSRDAGP